MGDDLRNRGPQDRSRINIHESWEVEWWTSHFGVTKERLIAAVRAVGVMARDVEQYLKRR